MWARTRRTTRRRVVASTLAVVAFFGSGCELEQSAIVDVEEVVVAEIYVNLSADPTRNEILGFLHRTVGTGIEQVADLVAARPTVTRSDGFSFPLENAGADECVESTPDEPPAGACFVADPLNAARLRPGDLLELTVTLADGGVLEGVTLLPGSFDLAGEGTMCRIDPDTRLPLVWSRSEGAWAYVNETAIAGLPAALRPEGIVVDDDPLYLLGISVSDSDTTIVFPSEFGVFNRFELDQDLAVRLQRGLPRGARAEITITAVDRNYVNWARGGDFNPSGQVRIPSLRGPGTGVFASTVGRRLIVSATADPSSELPPCPRSG